MNLLLEGLWLKSQEVSDYNTSISGQQFFGKKPSCASEPYVVLNLIVGTHDSFFDYTESTDKFEDFTIQFTIVSKSESPTEAGNILEDLKALYDNAILTITGYTNIEMKRLTVVGPEWNNDDRIYLYYIRYDVSLQGT
ncbi:MAG: hypothetical protein GQ540_03630 [Lutibacter sp.]|nr:hypothetical protein [Lutibacter sp.]